MFFVYLLEFCSLFEPLKFMIQKCIVFGVRPNVIRKINYLIFSGNQESMFQRGETNGRVCAPM